MSDHTHILRPASSSGAAAESSSVPATPTGEIVPDATLPTLVSDSPLTRPVVQCPVVFPGYEIHEELGRGGMGVVYKARQRSLNRLVALKVIIAGPHASSEDKARFRVEAEAGARLKHPNIVQVYDIGEHAGFSYMALEMIEGGTLRNWQDGKPIEVRLAARIAIDIGSGVQHAHDHGIVHRDLKPANILLGKDESSQGSDDKTQIMLAAGSGEFFTLEPSPFRPKITDFGLAKDLAGGTNLTITGTACGTPNYMAPEQVRGRKVGMSADVYGLGAVFFELLTGRPPFVGSDAAEVMDQILKTDPPDVRKLVPSLPRDLAVIAAKCLEKDPARRYLAVGDVVEDLKRFLDGRPILARPVGPLERGWRWVRRNPVAAGILVVTTLTCAVMGSMALALQRSVGVERAARAYAEQANAEMLAARKAAETARDEARNSQHTAETQKSIAEAAKLLADIEKAKAVAEKAVADAERKRAQEERKKAEDNLRIARKVIRTTLEQYSRDARFEGPAFQAFRNTMIENVRKFRDEVATVGRDEAEWFDDLADMSHWLGYLEFLNDNQPLAAAEYRAAATAASRWAAIEPDNPKPRWKYADSLVNSGNALVNHRQFEQAEASYRDAVAVIEAVVDRYNDGAYRRTAIESRLQLANVLRMRGMPQQQEEAARAALAHAWEWVSQNKTAEPLELLGAAYTELAGALARGGKPDETELRLLEAIAAYDRALAAPYSAPKTRADTAGAVLALAVHRSAQGRLAADAPDFEHAIKLLDEAARTSPDGTYRIRLADAHTQYGDHLRQYRQFGPAEDRYNRALSLLDSTLQQSPNSRAALSGWAKAATSRNHLLNQTGRHREAATEWAKLATREPDPDYRWRTELFVLQSLLFANDRAAASNGAETLAKKPIPNWMYYELARMWCLISKHAGDDADLQPADRLAASQKAIDTAVALLERGRTAGLFKEDRFIRLFDTNPDFAPVRDKFDPRK